MLDYEADNALKTISNHADNLERKCCGFNHLKILATMWILIQVCFYY